MIRMKTILLLLCITFSLLTTQGFVFAGGPDGEAGATARSGKKFKKGEILVKFRSGASVAEKEKAHKKLNSTKLREFKAVGIHHVKIAKNLSVEDAMALYGADPAVAYAEPNFVYSVQAIPNDPLFPDLYGLHNSGQQGTADADVDAPEAWDITTGSEDVVVAVVDTGVDYNHEDLSANIWTNPAEIPGNGIDDDGNGWADDVHGIDAANNDGDPMDDHSHGTHVSGTLGAVGNNSIGVAGMNWNVKIMALKFLSSNGTGYTSGAIACLDYLKTMKDRGVNIVAVNNSWGGGAYSKALEDAINAARDVLFLAAAGNSAANNDLTDFYPASYQLPNVLAVAATDFNDAIASFSNYGRRSVSVAAPGVTINSTVPNNGYDHFSGTSMATPHVTGLAALLKAAGPDRDWRAIKNLILAGGDAVPSVNGITVTGRRMNAYGSATCGGKKVFSALKPGLLTVGIPTTLSVLSIECESPVGPVTATASGGGAIQLLDDGIAPDGAAGDGIFTAAWTPVQMNDEMTFTSPLGTDVMAIQVSPVQIASSQVPTGMTGTYYSVALEARGGAAPYAWTVLSGSLPAVLSLNAATGELSGTPQARGQINIMVQVTDALGGQATQQIWGSIVDGYVWLKRHPLVNYWPYDDATGVAADRDGNVFVTGYIQVYDTPGTLHVLVLTVKYSAAGDQLWARTHDTGYYARAEAIAVDGQGNAYVAGYYYNGLQGFDWLVLKYDPSGSLVKTLTYSGSGDDMANGIVVDASGNIYATGSSAGRKNIDMLTIKYSAAGKQAWAKTYNGGYDDAGRAVSVDGSGNVAVAGSAGNGVDNDFVVVKYGPTGRALWTRTLAFSNDIPSGVGFDGSGNITVSGTTSWGESPNEYSDTLMAKYGPSGQLLWSKVHDLGGLHDYATGLVVAPNGDFYLSVTGYKIDVKDFIAAKFDPSGNEIWSKAYNDGEDTTAGIALDNAGHVYIGGVTVDYDSIQRDYLIIKYLDMP